MGELSKIIAVAAFFSMVIFSVSAAEKEPRHPLSQIHPVDQDFNLSEKDIYNISEIRLNGDGPGFELKNFSIMSEGGDHEFRLDSSGDRFNIIGADLDLNDRSIGSSNGALSLFSNLNAKSYRIINIPAPESGGDAVNKTYVDTDIEQAKDNATQNLQEVLSEGNSAGSYSIDLNGQNITSSSGTVNLDGKVYLPTGSLDMAGNNIINPGTIDGIDLDNPGNGLVIDNSRLIVGQNAIGDQEINNSDRITVSGLNSTKNVGLESNTIQNVSSVSGSGNIVISGGSGSEGVVLQQGDGTNVLEAGKDGGNVVVRRDLELDRDILAQGSGDFNIDGNGQNIVNRLDTGDEFIISDKSTGNKVLNASSGGGVALPQGNLDLMGHRIIDSGTTVSIGDATDDNVNLEAGGTGAVSIKSGDTASGSTERILINSNSGNADIDIKNSNLDLNGNSLKNHYDSQCPSGKALADIGNDGTFNCIDVAGEVSDVYVNRSGDSMTGNLDMSGNDLNNVGNVGVGTSSPQENLDVDGSASIENSGTRMEVDSQGNMVVTLGQ